MQTRAKSRAIAGAWKKWTAFRDTFGHLESGFTPIRGGGHMVHV